MEKPKLVPTKNNKNSISNNGISNGNVKNHQQS
jgi:hypothetical protein